MENNKENTYKFISVRWTDSIKDNSGWVEDYDFDAHEAMTTIESSGYCIKVTDKNIFLAQSIGNGMVSGVVSIPSGSILSIIRR